MTHRDPSSGKRRAAPWIAGWALLVFGGLGAATVMQRGAATETPPREPPSAVPSPRAAPATARSLRVSGPGDIGTFTVRVEETGGARVVTLEGATYRDGDAVMGGVAVRDKDDGGFVLTHGGSVFRFKAKDESGYSVRDEAGDVRFRVKVKEDKFNVYDGAGRRIGYGKEKKGQLQLRDDGGAAVGSIGGTTDLALAAILAVPIPVEVRAAALAHRVERLMP